MPIIGQDNFAGGLNLRVLGHNIAPNESTKLEGANIHMESLKPLAGYIRELIDFDKYPEIAGYPGSAGGRPNAAPILGRWRYYHDLGVDYAAWVRVAGRRVEYWVDGMGTWNTIVGDDWPNGVVPHAIQFRNMMYITHGDPATPYLCKYFGWDNDASIWRSGNVPVAPAPYHNIRPHVCATYKNRIYAVDTANEPYVQRFSGVNLPEEWGSPEGGYVSVGDDAGDPIVQLFKHHGYLYVFKRHSVWRYYIDLYASQHLEQLHGASGLIASRAVCAYHDAIYYVSNDGVNIIIGADTDCVSHNISADLEPHPDWLQYIQLIAHEHSETLWATYLQVPVFESEEGGSEPHSGEDTTDGTGDGYYVWDTMVWRADIRRERMLKPRWTKHPNLRITNFAFPPESNSYRGTDWQNLHFDAQQPDLAEWNPDPTADDPAYILADGGGPRNYSYRHNIGWDRDQIPARGYSNTRPADSGIGYFVSVRSRRFIPEGPMRRILLDIMRVDYFVWKSPPAHPGFDGAWMRIQFDEDYFTLRNSVEGEPTFIPLNAITTDEGIGGRAFQEVDLSNAGIQTFSLMLEWNVIGMSSRAFASHSFEVRWWAMEYKEIEGRYVPERPVL